MHIIQTKHYLPLSILDNQQKNVPTTQTIQRALLSSNALGYNLYINDNIAGFALLKQFESRSFFLWTFIVDQKYQNKGFGKQFLNLLFSTLQKDFHANTITTTYTFGNTHAQRLYEASGFIQTDIVEEDGIHEVNMIKHL